MSEQAHTPGPWEADVRTGCCAVYPVGVHEGPGLSYERDYMIYYQMGRGLRTMNGTGYPELTDRQAANARLIAAAPDLLAALDRLVDWCDQPADETAPVTDLLTEAHAAIAKAKGENQ